MPMHFPLSWMVPSSSIAHSCPAPSVHSEITISVSFALESLLSSTHLVFWYPEMIGPTGPWVTVTDAGTLARASVPGGSVRDDGDAVGGPCGQAGDDARGGAGGRASRPAWCGRGRVASEDAPVKASRGTPGHGDRVVAGEGADVCGCIEPDQHRHYGAAAVVAKLAGGAEAPAVGSAGRVCRTGVAVARGDAAESLAREH